MKNIFLVILLSFVSAYSSSSTNIKSISSPDGSLVLGLEINNGELLYSLYKNDVLIIENSRLGIIADRFDLSDRLYVNDVIYNTYNQTWTQVWGEEKEISNHYNELILGLGSNQNRLKMNIYFRLFND